MLVSASLHPNCIKPNEVCGNYFVECHEFSDYVTVYKEVAFLWDFFAKPVNQIAPIESKWNTCTLNSQLI